MPDITVSIDGTNLKINGTQYPLNNDPINSVFQMGTQQGITFNQNFWRKVYCGDVNKDGCSMDILKRTVSHWDYEDKISAADVKKMSSDMTNSLIDNNLIFKAEILRLKKYKTDFPEHLKTQFDSAFQENKYVYVIKDCGLNPAIFMVADKCKKTCNVASDVIDPHSAKIDDCNTLFPSKDHTLTLEPSVFEYLQYPRTCILEATTEGGGKYDLKFNITDNIGTTTPFTPDDFAGNATKKTSLKKGTNLRDIENNAKLCIAKYSGDTLQSFIQRIFQIHQNQPSNEFVISTCDSIVALRSFALKGSYIEITDDETKEKVTQVFIWRPNLANPDTLDQIFTAEKNKIVQEYVDFGMLIEGIIQQQSNINHDFNNIYISGSSTTYKFPVEFYQMIQNDIEIIATDISNAVFNPDGVRGISIRTLRTFKINDFIKINGKRGKYYCITMASKYTKGNLNTIGVNKNTMRIIKPVTRSFFEVGLQMFKDASIKFHGGKLHNKKNKRNYVGGSGENPPNPMDLLNMLNYYYDFDFYKSNPIVKTMFNDGGNDGGNDDDKERKNKDVDLHSQFANDFKIQFDKYIDIYNPSYNLLFFDCFSDALNSFGVLDMKYPKSRYYSEDSINNLIEIYFSKPSDIIKNFLSMYNKYNTNRLKFILKGLTTKHPSKRPTSIRLSSIRTSKSILNSSTPNRPTPNRLSSIRHSKRADRQSGVSNREKRNNNFLQLEKQNRQYEMDIRRGIVSGTSKTRKNRK